MKKIMSLIFAWVLSSTVIAAETVSSIDYTNVIGSSSVSGYSTLDDAIAELQKTADEMGGSRIYVTGAGGQNKIRATAVVMR